jgi:hypothetical protein
MVRDPETDVLSVNVILKNGTEFRNKDITEHPFGQEGMVAFWHEDRIRCYPLQDVAYVELVPA